ncbi:sugar ABC transporter substrate-binding protein [Neobacillus sp. BF23-41]|uniref:ABC transporter substrate-binding protein n=1 Tax=Neobacillus sp. BF23-41 TaxID=3240280 RepID=UPI0034E393D8
MKSLKKILTTAALCATLFATGCSSETSKSSTGASSSGGDKKETVSFTYWGGDFDKKRMESIRTEFNKEHPDINVKLIQIPSDGYDQKLLTSMAGGEPYDVVQVAEAFNTYAGKGTLTDLTPYMEKDGVNKDDYFKAGIDAYSYKGKVMAMPMRLGAMIMLYNKDLFDKNGIPYPTDQWTWEDFRNAAMKISNKKDGTFGVQGVGSWWANYMAYVESFGGGLMSDDHTKFTLDSPESKQALHFMQDMLYKDKVAPLSSDIPKGVDLWTSGKIGILVDGPWWILTSQANIKDFKWDVATLPKGAEFTSPLFSNAFAIPNGSKHKDAAWEVVKFWTGKEGQTILASEHGEVPPLKSVANSNAFLYEDGQSPNLKALVNSVDHAFVPPITSKWGEINKLADTYLGPIFVENKNIDKQLKEMKPQVEQLLKEAQQAN